MENVKGVLTEEQEAIGLRLDEPSYDTAVLRAPDGTILQRWLVREGQPTRDEIRAEAQAFLKQHREEVKPNVT